MISTTESMSSEERSVDVYSEDAAAQEEDMGDNDDDEEAVVVNISRSRGVVSDAAVVKWTYQMVEDSSRSQPHIISWTKEGDAFEIKDIEALETSILGNYFMTKKYSSFQKQMNNYRFERWSSSRIRKADSKTAGKSAVITFKHEHFQRGRADLLVNITKRKSKSNKRKSSNADELQTLKAGLVSLEQAQSNMRSAIENLKETSVEQKIFAGLLERHDNAKDEAIKALDYRVKGLESGLFTLLGPHWQGQHMKTSPFPHPTNDRPLDVPPMGPLPGFRTLTPNRYPPPVVDLPSTIFAAGRQPSLLRLDEVPMKIDPFFSLPGDTHQADEDGQAKVSLSRQATDQTWLKDFSFPDSH